MLWSIILPMLKPGLAVTVIFTWIFSWNEFRRPDRGSGEVTAKGRRRGFLPMETNAFDRVFIAVVTGIAMFLAYFRFFETDVSVWIPFGVWLAWLTVVVAKG